MTDSDGNVYNGEWKLGKFDGYGEYKWHFVFVEPRDKYDKPLTARVYNGQWKNGEMNGYGIHTDCKGNTYTGE